MRDVTSSQASKEDANNLNDNIERWEYRSEVIEETFLLSPAEQKAKIDAIYERNNLSQQTRYKAGHARQLLACRLNYLRRITTTDDSED